MCNFLILKLVIFLKTVTCECQHSYVTICNNLQDLSEANGYGTITQMTELVFKPDEPNSKEQMELFKPHDFYRTVRHAKSVIAVNQFSGVLSPYLPPQDKIHFDYLSFYGNDFQHLNELYFPYEAKLRKVSFVNNNIETLDRNTFRRMTVNAIDLSNNLIDVLESESVRDKTTVFIIKYNRITFIEANTFPVTLQTLQMDNNRLAGIPDNVLDNLHNLVELTLSNNNLKIMPNISSLRKLHTLHLSNNRLETIENDFTDNYKLRYVDLSYNKIKNADFVLRVSEKTHCVLSFNLVRDINISHFKSSSQQYLGYALLHPNPWWCHKWQQFWEIVKTKISYSDFRYIGNGTFPYCLNSSYVSTDQVDYETHIFYETINRRDPELLRWLIRSF